MLIFVTGCFGAPIVEKAKEIADQKSMDLLILDDAIAEKDGRSIRRICMAGGEHGYRNLEYEAVEALDSEKDLPSEGLVIACGDGILYDEQTRDLILKHQLVIVGEDMEIDHLWENALGDEDTWHAFMQFGSEEERRSKFEEYIARQKALFSKVKEVQARRG